MKTYLLKEIEGLSFTEKGIAVQVTRKEAMVIIQSLAAQLEHDSPNVGRRELWTEIDDDGQRHYFTIAVHQERL